MLTLLCKCVLSSHPILLHLCSRQQPPVKLQQVLPPLGIVLRLSPVGCQGVKKILRPQDLFQWTKTAQILQVNPQSCLVAS